MKAKSRRAKTRRTARLDWKGLGIAVLGLLLWTTNRRRRKPDFELSERSDVPRMIPSLVGITEGSIDRGNRVSVLFNGAYFDRLLEDIAAARQSIPLESYIWWKGEICLRVAEA